MKLNEITAMATLDRYKRGHTPRIQKGAKTSNSGVERNTIRYRYTEIHCACYWDVKQPTNNLENKVFCYDQLPATHAKACHDCLLVGCLLACLTSQQHVSVSRGRNCSDNCTCCHTEIEVADQTFHLTQSQYTNTGPTSPSTDPITPGAWQGSHQSANFKVTGMTRPRKNLGASGIRTRNLPLSRRTPYR